MARRAPLADVAHTSTINGPVRPGSHGSRCRSAPSGDRRGALAAAWNLPPGGGTPRRLHRSGTVFTVLDEDRSGPEWGPTAGADELSVFAAAIAELEPGIAVKVAAAT